MNTKKVFISTTSFAEYDKKPLEMLEAAGLAVEMNRLGRKLKEDEIKGFLQDIDFLIAGTEPITRDVITSSKKLKVVSRCGTGLDNVDLATASEFGIKVFNTPCGPTLAVAELTMGLIINILRKISHMDRDMRKGLWRKQMGSLLQGKYAGIIGFGRIGQRLAQMLLAFGAKVAYYDIIDMPRRLGCKFLDLKTLLSCCDIISLHCPAPSNGPVIGPKEFGLIKKGAYIINTSRPGLIDEQALCAALKDGSVAGACLDVFDKEPYTGKMIQFDNVILTPHIGSYAKEARIKMEIDSVENLLSYIGRK
ncbi:MAG: phosphoglycerate dehydrogenase [Candidatus Omnitrophica bacterium]|jgi:D-3-phosphoglycerate dehydrogenase|nr:phosphoglycerate dehydrogenase [Candidatus Omnitrophota bacterium]